MPEIAPLESSRPHSVIRHIPGWGLVVIGFVGLSGLLMICLAVLVALAPATPATISKGIASQTMPDGTILVLEEVTVGTRHQFHHQWSEPSQPLDWLRGNPALKYVEDETTISERQMLWFTRRDAKTGQALDFDWWEKCVAIDDHGWEIDDEDAGRDAHTHRNGSSGYGGSRPIPALPAEPYRAIVAHSSLPRMRVSAPTFKLKVFGKGQELVAEFDVPTKAIGTIPNWSPEPLPATKTDRDLSVTLTELHARPRQSNSKTNRLRPAFSLEPRFVVRRNGQPAENWTSIETIVSDAPGNTCGTWECRLSPFESAWKLNVRLFRPPTAMFEPSEQIVLENIEVPAPGNVQALSETLTIGPLKVELQAIGNGKVIYVESGGRSGGTSSTAGAIGEKNERFRIEQVDSGGNRTTTVDATVPHLRYRLTGLDHRCRFNLRVTSDQGVEISGNTSTLGESVYYLLPGMMGAKSLKIVAILQEGREVEFVVAPPEEFRATMKSKRTPEVEESRASGAASAP